MGSPELWKLSPQSGMPIHWLYSSRDSLAPSSKLFQTPQKPLSATQSPPTPPPPLLGLIFRISSFALLLSQNTQQKPVKESRHLPEITV